MSRQLKQEINVKRLIAAYRAGNSTLELARAYGVSTSTIYAMLRERGVVKQIATRRPCRAPRSAHATEAMRPT